MAQQRIKERITSKFTPWKVGNKVWLEMTNLYMEVPRKLQMKRTGPFKVEEVISHTTFHLHIPSHWKIHLVFHTSHLTSYKETTEHGSKYLHLSLDLIDGEEEYEVEAVLGHRGKLGCCTFLI